MDPLITVVLPVYNQENYVAQTIESVLAQTFGDFEFIILDDGSTDKSADVIREYTAQDARIKSYFEKNTGRAEATNKILTKARGKFCAFLDADDLMLPDRLEKQVAFHRSNPNVAASSCNCYFIKSNNEVFGIQKYPKLSTVEECNQVIESKELIVCAWTGLMILTNTFIDVGGLNSKFWPSDDYEFFNRLLDSGNLLVIIQENLMKYRVHPSSTTVKGPLRTFNMTNYVRDCFDKRRTGTKEVSFEEFMTKKNSQSLFSKIRERRFFYSTTILSKANIDLYRKNYIRFSYRFITAFLFSPTYVTAVISNKFKKK